MASSVVEGAPAADLCRSSAAQRVGQLARQSNLLLAHYQHRTWLDVEVNWQDGALFESKFDQFRLDDMVGSFNPAHRGKWTAHELCHSLVGWAWHPGADAWFHALAARLCELVPVALYYFADEADLRRCPRHQGGGPLFRSYCPGCEAAATEPGPQWDGFWIEEGQRFIDRELAAIARARRTGVAVSHRFGSLDLMDDGLAYAHAHTERLQSEWFEAWVAQNPAGRHDHLDDLEERALKVWAAIVDPEQPLDPWQGSWSSGCSADRRVVEPGQGSGPFDPGDASESSRGMTPKSSRDEVVRGLDGRGTTGPLERTGQSPRARQSQPTFVNAPWSSQSLAQRLWELSSMVDCGDLVELASRLSDPETISSVIADYEGLADAGLVPDPDEGLALGFDLPKGWGRSVAQIRAGLQTIAPDVVEGQAPSDVDGFLRFDASHPVRMGLGHRWATFLGQQKDEPAASRVRLQAAIFHAHPPLTPLVGPGNAWALAPHVDVFTTKDDPEAPGSGPKHWMAWRTHDDERVVVELDAESAELLQKPLSHVPESLSGLCDEGVLEPVA